MRALITGASSGLGKEMAKYLSEKNVDLVLVSRDEKKLLEVKEQLKTDVQIISADLSDAENCIKLYKEAGGIDVLINNAGFGDFGEFVDTDLVKELNMISTNVCAVHTLTKLFLRDMIEKNEGYILNVSSIAGFLPGPHMATYHATKAYVLKLTQSIYEEVRRRKSNVKICALCPGPIETPFLDKANVRFKSKPMSAESVAKYAIDSMLKGKYMILPGGNNKLIRILSKIVPEKFAGKIVYNMESARK